MKLDFVSNYSELPTSKTKLCEQIKMNEMDIIAKID